MRKGLAVTFGASLLALLSTLCVAAPLPMALPSMHAPARIVQKSDADQVGVRPAVLEIPIPNSIHRSLAHPVQSPASPAAEKVQWLTGPVPSRCQRGSVMPSGSRACLVI